MREIGVPCTVTYADEFDLEAAKLAKEFPRLDEMVRGAEWAIARTELRGEIVVGLYAGGAGPYLIVEATVTDELAIASHIRRQ